MTDLTMSPDILKKIRTSTLLVLLVGTIGVSAKDSATIPSDGMDDAQGSAVSVKRDPFWPVGYTPKWVVEKMQGGKNKAVEGIEGTDWNRAMEQVSIQGVSSRAGEEFYAIINGEVKSTGETISVQVGALTYSWLIESISPPSFVKLRRVSAQ